MPDFANLSPGALEAINKLEDELKAMGCETAIVAYTEEAKLSLDEIMMIQRITPEALDMILKLESDLRAQNINIALIASKLEED